MGISISLITEDDYAIKKGFRKFTLNCMFNEYPRRKHENEIVERAVFWFPVKNANLFEMKRFAFTEHHQKNTVSQ
jgi:hypothetical protein